MANDALPRFGSRTVRKAALVVRKTGDGLSEKLGFEPVALWPGDEVYLVVKAVVVDVAHPAENRKKPDQDDLIRVHIADAQEVAMIDYDVAEPLLKQADQSLAAYRLAASKAEEEARLAEERAQGIERLPIEGDEFDDVIAAHNRGEHQELVDDCPGCQLEVDAEEDEREPATT